MEYELSENPNYLSAGWIVGYIVVGGIIYYLIYKAKKDKGASTSSTSSSSSSLYGVDPAGFLL